MYKIIEIANHHQWDNVEMTPTQFVALIELLTLSNFYYDIKYEFENETFRIWGKTNYEKDI